jgi:hypothetical protein
MRMAGSAAAKRLVGRVEPADLPQRVDGFSGQHDHEAARRGIESMRRLGRPALRYNITSLPRRRDASPPAPLVSNSEFYSECACRNPD